MKILIQNDGRHAHYYIRLGLARAFELCGHNVRIWDMDKKAATDVFDELEPDIFIGQTYNTTETIANLIRERPHLAVEMKAGDWGELSSVVSKKYPITMATQQEKDIILKLKEDTGKPDYLHIHYHPDYIEQTHGEWIKAGVNVHSQLSAADVFEFYNGQQIKELESDVCFIGGYWPYKAQVMDKWLVRFCNKTKLRVKIFGNSPWPVHQYCGFLPPNFTCSALKSTKVCVNLHEPHSQEYGFDVVERPFKLLSARTLVVSDYVDGLHKLFPNGIVYANTPEEFEDKINEYVENSPKKTRIINNGHSEVMNKHTYFHRISEIFNRLELPDEAYKVRDIYNKKLGTK